MFSFLQIQFSGSKGYNSSFSQQDSEIVQQNSSSESTNSILIGLVPGTDYSIEIAATTGGGTGNFSTALKVKTLFAGLICSLSIIICHFFAIVPLGFLFSLSLFTHLKRKSKHMLFFSESYNDRSRLWNLTFNYWDPAHLLFSLYEKMQDPRPLSSFLLIIGRIGVQVILTL